jgi:hypothetical protein
MSSRKIKRALPVALPLLALAGLLVGTASRAYVRSKTDKGTPIYWPGSCVWIQPDSGGSPDLPFPTVLDQLTKSIAAWQKLTLQAGCSYLKIIIDPAGPLDAHLDHVNGVKFVTGDQFCRPAETGRAEMCYSPAAAAITTVFYTSNPGARNDGQIVDADIELNSVNFTFVIADQTHGPARRGTMIADLANTLTHELGHFQGLDHTCWDDQSKPDPTDNNDKPIPDCGAVQTKTVPGYTEADYDRITLATMYNFAAPGEIIKRTPEADDVAGICGIYPRASDPMTCERPSWATGGCSTGGGHGAGGLGTVFALLTVLTLARRGRYSHL